MHGISRKICLTIVLLNCAFHKTSAQAPIPGSILWKVKFAEPIGLPPALGPDGTVYVAEHGIGWARLHALDGRTGAQIWSVILPNGRLGFPPVIGEDGTVFVPSVERIEARRGSDGVLVWSYPQEGSGPAIMGIALKSDGTLLVTLSGGELVALHAKTGLTRWRVAPVPGAMLCSPASVGGDGTIYVIVDERSAVALESQYGAVKWSTALINPKNVVGHIPWHPPAIGKEDLILFQDGGYQLVAVDGKLGTIKWRHNPRGSFKTPTIGPDGTIFYSLVESVVALSPADGRIKWTYQTETGTVGSETLGSDGTLYIGTYRNLHFVNSRTGVRTGRFFVDDAGISAPVLSSDGILYCTTLARNVVAVHAAERGGLAQDAWPNTRHDGRHTGAMTVSGPPVVYDLPTTVAAPLGEPVLIGSDSNGSPPLRYQWLRNEQPLDGQTNGTLYIEAVDWTDAGDYVVRVTNSQGETTSNPTTLSTGYRLTVVSTRPERVQISPNLPIYPQNAEVRLEAETNAEPLFLGWRGAITGSSPTLSLTMTNHLEIEALFEPAPGEVKWEFVAGDAVNSPAAISENGTLYFASDANKVYAVDAETGKLKWSSAGGINAVVGADGTIFSRGIREVYALNGETGATVWKYSHPSVSVVFQTALTLDANGYLYAFMGSLGGGFSMRFDAKTGAAEGLGAGSRQLTTPALAADGTLFLTYLRKYFIGGDWFLSAFPVTDGVMQVQKWELKTPPVSTSLAIGFDGTVYFGTDNKRVFAVNGQTGIARWDTELGGKILSTPVLTTDGVVIVGSEDRKVYGLDQRTGRKQWEFETGGSVSCTAAAAADGTVYIGSTDKKMYALDSRTGAKKWEFMTLGPVRSSPTIGEDGTVYFGSGDGKFYAVRGSSGLAPSAWPKDRQNVRNTGRLDVVPLRFDPARLRLSDSQVEIGIIGARGNLYQLEWTSDFSSWMPITVLTNATEEAVIQDERKSSDVKRFYRARVLEPR